MHRHLTLHVQTRFSQQGSVLLIVLVVVMVVAFGAYSFSELMLTDLEATAMFGREVQARACADSALEFAAAVVRNSPEEVGLNCHDNAWLFHGILMRSAGTPRGRGRFSIVAPAEHDPAASSVRFGLTDESTKTHLNSILRFHPDETDARERLLQIPRITRDVADAILDWLDEDEIPRRHGAERESYDGVPPRNGPFQSLEELLLVRGVTWSLLYGEDVNRNGLLDPNENDGRQTTPLDDEDGVLDHGWIDYFTVHGRERNRQPDGSPRINLNNQDLRQLQIELARAFGERIATYVISYRRNGPQEQSERRPSSLSPNDEDGTEKPAIGEEKKQDQHPIVIRSVYDLIGVQVMSARTQGEVLDSPWSDDPQQMLAYVPALEKQLSTRDGDAVEGRVNINQARKEVLLTVPGIDEQLALAIITRRNFGFTDERSMEPTVQRSTTAWLVAEGLIDLDQMRRLAPFVTARGDVYRVQAIGYFDQGGPMWRTEALIDVAGPYPIIHSQHDLTRLGGNLTWMRTRNAGGQ